MAEKKPITTTILRTDEMWTGDKYPDYLKGKPEIVVNKVIIPPHSKLPWHHHDIMSFAYVIEGEFYIVCKDGKEKCFTKGNALGETIGTIHRGENRSDENCELVVFYPSQKDIPLSILHPECEDGN